MAYKRNYTHIVEEDILTEWRGRIKQSQQKRLKELETKLNIPQAALVRLALDCFLPKIRNENYKEEGILNLWNSSKF